MKTKHCCPPLLLVFAICFILAAALAGCSSGRSAAPISRTGFAFDTVVTITIYDERKTDVLDHCLALCAQYENLFSATQEGSEVWNINHSDGTATAVSHETAALIQSALYYCDQTQGMLDLTLRPVSEEWDIAGQMKEASALADYQYKIPSAQTLSALIEHVDYKNVQITDAAGTEIGYDTPLFGDTDYFVTLKDSRSAIDLGFIAKGYIADQLKAYLVSEGVESGIISLGGNVLLIGSKPDRTPFTVGIQKPFGAPNETITTAQKSDISVVSSGCYERYFIVDDNEKDKRIYHHILDTKTGSPVWNDLFGVTIFSDSSMEGDALSTCCYILGLEKGMEYIRGMENVEAVFVTKDYEVIYCE
ncbi:MAG: FAD:protein FMN transferase [Lachnospiraceae bacterium]|nr:FAD:protein FMN transferase [Lachnospiraceae bacterium]